jgi:predicted HTH domain antitoxin
MKTDLVSIRLEKDQKKAIDEMAKDEKTDRATALRKTLDLGTKQYNLEKAIEKYSAGKIGVGLAAKQANISLWEMMDILKQKNIPSSLTKDDYKKGLENLLKIIDK